MNKGHWSFGRSSLALDIKLDKQHNKEFLMSHRNMRIYWNDTHSPLYGQLKCFTRWLYLKKCRSKRRNEQRSSTHIGAR